MNWKEKLDKKIRKGDIVYHNNGENTRYKVREVNGDKIKVVDYNGDFSILLFSKVKK